MNPRRRSSFHFFNTMFTKHGIQQYSSAFGGLYMRTCAFGKHCKVAHMWKNDELKPLLTDAAGFNKALAKMIKGDGEGALVPGTPEFGASVFTLGSTAGANEEVRARSFRNDMTHYNTV